MVRSRAILLGSLVVACGGASPAPVPGPGASAPVSTECVHRVRLGAVEGRDGDGPGRERVAALATEALEGAAGVTLDERGATLVVRVIFEVTPRAQGVGASVWLHVERTDDDALIAVLHTVAASNANDAQGEEDALCGALAAAVGQLEGALPTLVPPARGCEPDA